LSFANCCDGDVSARLLKGRDYCPALIASQQVIEEDRARKLMFSIKND